MKKYRIAFIALAPFTLLSCRTNGNQESRAMDSDNHDIIPFIRKDTIKTRLDKLPDESTDKARTNKGNLASPETTGANNLRSANHLDITKQRDSSQHGDHR
jgi:hypothetical protein